MHIFYQDMKNLRPFIFCNNVIQAGNVRKTKLKNKILNQINTVKKHLTSLSIPSYRRIIDIQSYTFYNVIFFTV